jgi:N-acetylated-alpha-linked acidic dipeptidase
LAKSAAKYDEAKRKASPKHVQIVNAKLIEAERGITDAAGLPGRPWFKNVIYAPGLYTGYGVKTIPGVREAIEQKRWEEAGREIRHVADILSREAALIDDATGALAN